MRSWRISPWALKLKNSNFNLVILWSLGEFNWGFASKGKWELINLPPTRSTNVVRWMNGPKLFNLLQNGTNCPFLSAANSGENLFSWAFLIKRKSVLNCNSLPVRWFWVFGFPRKLFINLKIKLHILFHFKIMIAMYNSLIMSL